MASTPHVLTDDELREGLTACLAVPRWVDEVVAAGPYGSMIALLDAAAAAANPLTEADVDAALAHHPRIGERPVGQDTAATFSRSEQASSASPDEQLAAALAEGNRAYEERFGRVFLIRAAGRSRPQILAELQRRLQLDEATELAIVASELRDIALLRIPQLFAHLDHHSGYNLPEAAGVSRSRVTTHVLDAVTGRPAVGVAGQLEARTPDGWSTIAMAVTDGDGRIADLGPVDLDPGTYRITFATGAYFRGMDTNTFYPEVVLTFTLDDPEAHYHVPLLLSPYAFSTYRGS